MRSDWFVHLERKVVNSGNKRSKYDGVSKLSPLGNYITSMYTSVCIV